MMQASKGKILTSPSNQRIEVPLIPTPEFILSSAARFGDSQVCFIHAETKRTLTHSEVRTQSRKLAASLQKVFRLKPGQNVAIALPNCLEFPIVVLGVTLCGATACPINPSFNARELKNGLSIIEPVLVFCMKDFTRELQRLPLSSNVNYVVLDGKSDDCTFGFNCLLSKATLEDFTSPTIDCKSDAFLMLLSSGTTGLPKGVLLTHFNVNVAVCQNLEQSNKIFAKEIYLVILPMYHQYGCLITLINIAYGPKLVILPKFTLPGMLQAIQEFKVTRLPLVPSVAVLLAKHPLADQYDLKSLTVISSAAAPLSVGVIKLLTVKYGLEVLQVYGMTELTQAAIRTPIGYKKPGSVGVVTPTFEVKVVDVDTGRMLGPNEQGEICLRGPMVMKGYHGNKSATESLIDSEGWLHSGDIGYYDEEGWFYICDRLKELIKYKGMQVVPAELEAVLLSHTEITDAAVVGLANEEAGEVPAAFVVRKPGSQITSKQVQDFVEGQVSNYKKLRGGVYFMDAIPRTPSGKILRRELRSLQSRL